MGEGRLPRPLPTPPPIDDEEDEEEEESVVEGVERAEWDDAGSNERPLLNGLYPSGIFALPRPFMPLLPLALGM